MGTKRKASSSTPKPQSEPQKPKLEQPQSPSSDDDEEEEEEEEEVEYEEEEEEVEYEEEEEVEEEEEEVEYEEQSEPESEAEAEPKSESEPEDESTKQESIRKLLEPFSKDQIIHLFKTAASTNDPSILSRVTSLADTDPTHRKIFVHGLGYDATSEQLLDAFKPYGEIEECKLITDKVTGRAKGYGFVLFKSRVGSKRALKEPQKRIGNRTTSCQLAAVGSAGTNQDSGGGRKIYVGNVGADVESEKLRAFFAKFGEIEEGPYGIDSLSRKFKGFAIFVYRNVEGANKALEEPQKLFDGCQLFCKKFVENSNNASGSSNVNQGVQQNEMNYGYGVAPGILGGNGVPILMGQNMGFGMNPLLASGFNPSFGGIGAGYGINGISPIVVGSYGSDPATQGLGTYQGAQLWQPSYGGSAAMATITTPAKDSSGGGGVTYPSSLGR